jgi:hypothetical protein
MTDEDREGADPVMNEMNLKEFVSSSITQIIEGVADAIERSKNRERAFVNPVDPIEDHTDATELSFNVAVTVTDRTEAGGKAGITVVGFKLGGGVDIAFENQSISRLAFKVPVALPSVAISKSECRDRQNAEITSKRPSKLYRGA